MTRRCFYDLPDCSSTLTREHVISAAALAAIGGSARNYTLSFWRDGPKTLAKADSVIRDVCHRCNSTLSTYDERGAAWVCEVAHSQVQHRTRIAFGASEFGWVVKTHLNHLRTAGSARHPGLLHFDRRIRHALVHKKPIPQSTFLFFVQGWELTKDYWSAGTDYQEEFFNYRALLDDRNNVWISGFRIGHVETLLLFPSNGRYLFFTWRAAGAMALLRHLEAGFTSAPVNTRMAIASKVIDLGDFLPEIRFDTRFCQEIKSDYISI